MFQSKGSENYSNHVLLFFQYQSVFLFLFLFPFFILSISFSFSLTLTPFHFCSFSHDTNIMDYYILMMVIFCYCGCRCCCVFSGFVLVCLVLIPSNIHRQCLQTIKATDKNGSMSNTTFKLSFFLPSISCSLLSHSVSVPHYMCFFLYLYARR